MAISTATEQEAVTIASCQLGYCHLAVSITQLFEAVATTHLCMLHAHTSFSGIADTMYIGMIEYPKKLFVLLLVAMLESIFKWQMLTLVQNDYHQLTVVPPQGLRYQQLHAVVKIM